jgi:hypothetical protein
MDTIVESYLEILSQNPDADIPVQVLRYHFQKTALELLEKQNNEMLGNIYLSSGVQPPDTPCPTSRTQRMSLGGVDMER